MPSHLEQELEISDIPETDTIRQGALPSGSITYPNSSRMSLYASSTEIR